MDLEKLKQEAEALQMVKRTRTSLQEEFERRGNIKVGRVLYYIFQSRYNV